MQCRPIDALFGDLSHGLLEHAQSLCERLGEIESALEHGLTIEVSIDNDMSLETFQLNLDFSAKLHDVTP